MSEKLCLQWNDFQENIKIAFGNLREDSDFADVTLACEDGQQEEAHKVILAASSPFFQKLLGRNKHPHPLIYMRGVKSDDLLAIVDFLYRGEANVFQENLDSFLAIAEELQLKGLVGKRDENVQNFAKFEEDDKFVPPTILPTFHANAKFPQNSFTNRNSISSTFSGNLDELENRVKSLMEKSQNKIASGCEFAQMCKVCGKEGYSSAIKDHIEVNHLEGIVIPCKLCDKTFKYRNGLRKHKRLHQNNPI